MDWITIIGFIVFGIVLIVIEIIFVPGTTVVGIGGFVCVGYGIYLSFVRFDNATGYIVLSTTAVLSVIILISALKSKAWERFSLKDTIDGRVNEIEKETLKVGDRGMSISSLKPIGKGLFNDEEFEIRTSGEYLDENKEIQIIKIDHNKIFVEPVTEA